MHQDGSKFQPMIMKCHSCGAPMDIDPNETLQGFFKCEYCDSVTRIEQPQAKKIIASFGIQDVTSALKKATSRPQASAINIENDPGRRLIIANKHGSGALIPGHRWLIIIILVTSIGPILPGIFVGFGAFTGFRVFSMIIEASFFITAGIVGYFVLRPYIRKYLGSIEKISAENGLFTITYRTLGKSGKENFPLNSITDVYFEPTGWQVNNASQYGLYFHDGVKKRLLFSGAPPSDEIRWIHTELRKFFKPLWKKK